MLGGDERTGRHWGMLENVTLVLGNLEPCWTDDCYVIRSGGDRWYFREYKAHVHDHVLSITSRRGAEHRDREGRSGVSKTSVG
ncbi:hypothetical protein E2C01_037004 [Portunus trituberculatus]|uniref:Uncharacterized protein n=1 Tax=Portunus trituberculatus TaxID=210409 RepID=A0A5B7FDL6_PORTR|nr:hypothetical protein [Portunus trituberculatus]